MHRRRVLRLADAARILHYHVDLAAAIGELCRSRVLAAQRDPCDHEGVPRGTASRWKRRYAVRLTVPRRGGWRAWDLGVLRYGNLIEIPAVDLAGVTPRDTAAQIREAIKVTGDVGTGVRWGTGANRQFSSSWLKPGHLVGRPTIWYL